MTARFRAVFAQELSFTLRRPLLWFMAAILLLMSWGMSTGGAQIQSGDATVGGTKAWITSEFSFAFVLLALVTLIYSFFLSIAAGTTVIRDDEARVGEVLHGTPLKPGEYVWGKFLAILTGFVAVLGLHLLFSIFFNHVVPNPAAAEIRGPFELVNYLRPAVIFALPALVFFAGFSFFLGERWRSPMPAFMFPVSIFLICGFFLWNWSPTWLDPRINRILMLIDPGGFRWLNETWLKLDRGADFYNTARIGLDLPFALSRLVFLGIGLLGVALSHRHLGQTVRGRIREPWRLLRRRLPAPDSSVATAVPVQRPLASLGMSIRPAGLIGATLRVARIEARELLASPAIYLFGALILVQTLGNAVTELGSLQTRLLLTPGQLAVSGLESLTVMLCLLLMFYTGQSLERERATGMASLAYSAPVPTASLLFGKVLANSLVGVVVITGSFLGSATALLIQGKVPLDPVPYILVWGLLLLPTLLMWTSFILAVQSLTGHRLATYGIGLAALALTFYRLLRGTSWVGNWILWEAVSWTDMGPLQLDRKALVLSRLLALGLTAFFTAVAVHAFGRRQADAVGTLHRLQRAPASLLRLAPFAAVPLIFGTLLWLAVLDGFGGGTIEKKGKDYWQQNLATWLDAPQPALTAVDIDVEIEPERRHFHTRGTYELVNDRAEPLSRFAFTGEPHWKNVKWTLRGKPFEPDNRSGLYVFPGPIPPGGRLRVGFDMEGQFPEGISKNGGGLSEFILPAGVVLTSFRPSFVPVIGFFEGIGVKKGENDYEPREYPDDYFRGQTDSFAGTNRPFRTRIRVTGPADYTWNSVGTRVSEVVRDGRRSVVWQSERPVNFFNVVGGRWKERRGRGTVIYYHPEHEYNIDDMSVALDAARRWYSEWFHPFPWRELKLSEFPSLANYAQGFPTNITFSEGIGFLAETDEKTDIVFAVTAHETAHQWWGNLIAPGKGPGGSILSEGMSHFSTLLLMEKVKGPKARMAFARQIEESYANERRPDAERPLVKIDNSREGDKTVTYDKGGWVFWMLMRQMGPDRALAGLRQFILDWSGKPDHPVLQDFLAAMRPFAADPAAFDAFAKQWFHEVVVPQYELTDARKEKAGGHWRVTAKLRNAGTGRMPVQVASVRGDRDARATVVLGSGETRTVEILSPFEPERLVVDPDVHVLQLRRKSAVAELGAPLASRGSGREEKP